jgi:DNA-binding HxlR family transcriptional regulator
MARQPAPAVCERFHEAIELIGARWTGAIIQVLLNGPVRYADLRAAVPEISDRMLCERLRALEDAAIVQRRVSTDPPVRVDYDLTDKGKALGPALNAIGRWAEQWAASGEARPEARRPAKVSASPRVRRTAGV